MYRIGVDLGGTNIAIGVVDGENRLAASAHTPTRPELGRDAVVAAIIGCIDNALLLSGITPEECAGIGIGCPGSCDAECGIVRNAHNLGWAEMPLRACFEREYGLPVFLENDANCAALGECAAGAARGAKSALMITLGTGIGSGMIIGGKIYSGFRGLGAEFGHMCIDMGGEACTCGRRGCWEAYASATALVNQARAAAKRCPESILNEMESMNGEKVFLASDENDAAAMQVVENYYRYVSIGIINAVNMLFPEIVIIGGGIARRGERLLEPIRKYVSEEIFARGMGVVPKIVLAELGSDAGIIGAAQLCRSTKK